jgi:hypothetical protein
MSRYDAASGSLRPPGTVGTNKSKRHLLWPPHYHGHFVQVAFIGPSLSAIMDGLNHLVSKQLRVLVAAHACQYLLFFRDMLDTASFFSSFFSNSKLDVAAHARTLETANAKYPQLSRHAKITAHARKQRLSDINIRKCSTQWVVTPGSRGSEAVPKSSEVVLYEASPQPSGTTSFCRLDSIKVPHTIQMSIPFSCFKCVYALVFASRQCHERDSRRMQARDTWNES